MERLPEEFRQRMERMLGEEYEAFLASYEKKRRPGLRLNALKKGAERLPGSGCFRLTPVAWAPGGFYYDPDERPGRHPFHECGVYYIQEPSAMAVAALSGVKPGMRVLDLCAAPGGKSTQLASMLKGEGLLLSNEIHPARAKILSQNIERMGIPNAIVTNEPPERLKERFALFFDTVVVDAPCSGEGMFVKEPEAVPNWSLENVKLCAARQLAILDCAAEMTAPGGTLVYSTCTFAPLEDERNVAVFLVRHPEFEIVDLPEKLGEVFMDRTGLAAGVPAWADAAFLTAEGTARADAEGTAQQALVPQEEAGDSLRQDPDALRGCLRLWPHKLEGEGHFLAVLRKKGEGFVRSAPAASPLRDKEAVRLWKEFCRETLTGTGESRLSTAEMPSSGSDRKKSAAPGAVRSAEAGLLMYGSELYRVPYPMELKGLRVLRPGLHLGTVKKNRFEPSHSLALFLRAEDVRCSAEICESGSEDTLTAAAGSRAAAAYLRGESIPAADCGAAGEKGWCLVTISGFSAGWGKISSGQVKNHYPKGLRRPH